MKAFNFDNIESSGDGDYVRLPAGPYVARIISATDSADKKYVEVVFDIAEGEHANYYDDDWGRKHPYAHHFFMSYKDSALSMLKGRLEAITASNPGFDAISAWNAGRTDMFIGRLIGINLQEEEYEYQGEVKTRLNVCQVVDAQKVRDGSIKTRATKQLSSTSTANSSGGNPVTTSAATANIDVPFD